MGWFPVDPQFVTPEWLSEVLGGEVRSCRLEQIGVGIGLLGRLYRVHLEGRAVPASVVIKFPTLDQQARSALGEDLVCSLEFARKGQPLPAEETPKEENEPQPAQ